MGTFVIAFLLAGSVLLAIRRIVDDRKKGKSISCGGDCSRCGGCCYQ